MPDSNPYNKRYFKSDLLPPKSKEEVELLVEIDNTLIYSFLLIFFGMFVYFILTMIQVILVDPAIATVEANLKTVDDQINSFNGIRETFGELYIKARSLEPILDRDVKVTKVLELEEKIRIEFPNLIDVVDYARRSDGAFTISFLINSASRVDDIMAYLEEQPDVSDIFLDKITWAEGQAGTALVDISFKIENITSSNG